MSLTNITNTTTIYRTGALTSSTGYNEVLTVINGILLNDYGYKGSAALQINSGDVIKADHWNSLITDLDIIWRHQRDQSFTVQTTPVAGDVVGEYFANQLINAVNDADIRRHTRPPANQRSSLSVYSSTGTTTASIWPSVLEHEVDLSWLGATSDLLHYFYLGGRLTFNLDCQTSTATNNIFWSNFINSSKESISSFVFDANSLIDLKKWPLYTTSTTYTDGANSIRISVESLIKNPNVPLYQTLRMKTALINDKTGVNLNTTSTLTYEYSTNAITAELPIVTVRKQFGDNYIPVVNYVGNISVSVPNRYEWRAGSTSTEQTVVITNIGNTATTIESYGIVLEDYPGISSITTYGWDITQPKTLAFGTTVSFTLKYYSDVVEPNGFGRIIIRSDRNNNSGEPYVVRTYQTVKPKLFSFTLSPAFISYSTSSSSLLEQKFNIVPSDGTYTAQPAVSIVPNAAYTISNQELNGPTIQFNTSTNGTYTTVLSVVVTGTNSVNEITTATVTAPISIYRNAPTTENLGTWKSALQPFNGIIGASYDLIDGKRYVTIGFGMGADGSYSLANDPTGASAFVEFLGTNTTTVIVDSKYDLNNPPIYAGGNDGAYTPFLQSTTNVGGYGTWIRPSSYQGVEGGQFGPYNIYVNRTYKFVVTTAGLHTWTMSSDNESYFIIDGALVGDLRNVGRDQSYKREYTGSVYLEAGEHILTFYVINTNGPAAIALKIVDTTSLEVWSTRFPIRIGSVYQNWQEVYRIPLTGAAQSYQCNDAYCIKNSNNVNGQRWGYYFGSAGTTANSMFTVTDDGSGNITIAMNSVNVNSSDMTTLNSVDSNSHNTIDYAAHLFYYFSYLRDSIGYTQLSTAPASDGTTQYFLGFTRDGAVRTSSVIPPTDPTNTIVTPSDNPGNNNNIYYYEQ
jgi:hypothetical protein